MVTRRQIKRYVGKWVAIRTNQGVVRGQLISFDGKHLKLHVPRKPNWHVESTSLDLASEQADIRHSIGSDSAQMSTVGYPYVGYPYCYPCYPWVVPFVAVTGVALLSAGLFFF